MNYGAASIGRSSFGTHRKTLRQVLQSIGFNDADITTYGAVVGPAALDTFGQPEHKDDQLGNYH
jgi:hypothetical protein